MAYSPELLSVSVGSFMRDLWMRVGPSTYPLEVERRYMHDVTSNLLLLLPHTDS